MADGDVIPAPTGGVIRSVDRSIGAILVDAGKLKASDVELVLRRQRERGVSFGDAAIELGLLTRADIDFALSSQFKFAYLLRGESAVSEQVFAAYSPFSRQVEALRSLRSQLLMRWFYADPANKALAIISADRGEGRSYIASNLAVVFSQLGERTLLVDADMRNPCIHSLFSVDNRVGLSAILSDRVGLNVIHRVPGLADLCILPAGAQPPNPSELLSRPYFRQLLLELGTQFDVILLDTPATGETSDAQAISVAAGGALIVVRKNAARVWRVKGVAEGATQSSAKLVGSVLNEY